MLSDYLEPGHYYGIDVNNDIITTGYDRELTDEQRARIPVSNLHSTDRFDCDFETTPSPPVDEAGNEIPRPRTQARAHPGKRIAR